jgi:hypothetical protein
MTRRDLTEIGDLVTALSSLHKQKEQIESRIVTYENRVKELINEPSEEMTNGRSPIPGFLDQNRSVPDRVVLLLDSDPDHEFTPEEVKDWLPDSNINSVRSALVRLTKAGEIDRLGQGRYRSVNGGEEA